MFDFKLFAKHLRKSGLIGVLIGYSILFFVGCILFTYTEPETIKNYSDALWFGFQSIFTIGYGDLPVVHLSSRIFTVVLVLGGVVVIAIIPTVFVAYFNDRQKKKQGNIETVLFEKLENLDSLNAEEIHQLANIFRHSEIFLALHQRKEHLLATIENKNLSEYSKNHRLKSIEKIDKRLDAIKNKK